MSINRINQWVQGALFGNRLVVLLLFLAITTWLGLNASKIKPDASLERMIPLEHPYIENFLAHRGDLENLANFIRIAVAARSGDIFSAEYMDTLEQVNEAIFNVEGVDRSGLKSLWTPNVRWVEVTENGFAGGTVIPNGYDGDAKTLDQLRRNILRSGQVGRLIANDFKSSIVYVPLLERNKETGEALDYLEFSRTLERDIRDRFGGQDSPVDIHIVGFAKKTGDLIEGLGSIVSFFGIAALMTMVLLFVYSRCWKSTLATLVCSLIAVIWQLGLMRALGYGLDPYSVLIPFIVFATAISHGVQYINGMHHSIADDNDKLTAARLTFGQHFLPALLALISDAIGFFTLILIEVEVIKDLAIGASVGIASIILTNMVMLPIILSITGVSKRGIRYTSRSIARPSLIWRRITGIANRQGAKNTLYAAFVAVAIGSYFASDVKIGELSEGAPELRPDSRYNLDNAYITSRYSTSADVMVIMVKSAPEQCTSYRIMTQMDRLQWEIDQLEAVQSSVSLVNVSKMVTRAFNEGNLRWFSLSRNQSIIDTSLQQAPKTLINNDCSLAPILVFLNDHKSQTLQDVVDVVEAFNAKNDFEDMEFLLAAGNAGIEVATNQVIEEAQTLMLVVVYAVVAAMVLLAYRSLRAVICIVLPLGMTSILCMALMSLFEIGIKVSTLPIIALGVGLGVDYGIYIYSKIQKHLLAGATFYEAYYQTVLTTGKAVAFTGLTLAIGTATWMLSPIQFQSDMGVLLTFMFLWNMIGAMTLLPALSYYFLRSKSFKL